MTFCLICDESQSKSVIICNVLQSQFSRLLSGRSQVRALPGSPIKSMRCLVIRRFLFASSEPEGTPGLDRQTKKKNSPGGGEAALSQRNP
jgi:hypothetical protein